MNIQLTVKRGVASFPDLVDQQVEFLFSGSKQINYWFDYTFIHNYFFPNNPPLFDKLQRCVLAALYLVYLAFKKALFFLFGVQIMYVEAQFDLNRSLFDLMITISTSGKNVALIWLWFFVGTAVVTMDKAALWTDGRYFEEAENALDCNWIFMKQGSTLLNLQIFKCWFSKIGILPWLWTSHTFHDCQWYTILSIDLNK